MPGPKTQLPSAVFVALLLALAIACRVSNEPASPSSVEGSVDGSADAVAVDASGEGSAAVDGGEAQATEPCAGGATRSMWVWTSAAVTNAVERQTLLDFCKLKGIGRLYLQAGAGTYVLTRNVVVYKPMELSQFIVELRAKCITVELLYGAASWALRDNHGIPVTLAEQVAAYARAHPEAAPAAIHFDVEAHAVAGEMSEGMSWEWSIDAQRAPLVVQYLELLDKMHAALSGSSVGLGVDIPFWYDTHADLVPLAYGGVTTTPFEHVMARVSMATVMSWRDTKADLEEVAGNEVRWASAHGGRVAIGLEAGGCHRVGGVVVNDQPGNSDADLVTFCDEGRVLMESVAGQIEADYATEPGFAHLAIHDYQAYSDPTRMLP